MSTINLLLAVSYPETLSGVQLDIGQTFNPIQITAGSGLNFRQSFSILTTASSIVLNLGTSSTDDLADFDFLYVIVDQVGIIEFTGSAASTNSNLGLAANKPFILVSDNTLVYNSGGAFAGAADDIKAVRIKNTSASTMTGFIFAAT